MSGPGIGINSTQVPIDTLSDILTVVKEMRDLMCQKADKEKTPALCEAPHQSNGAPDVVDAGHQEPLNIDTASPDTANQSDDSPAEADAIVQESLNTETTSIETNEEDDWPDDETIATYKVRCAKHRSECEMMEVELGCFIAHLGIVGGDKDVIKEAENLRKGLLEPVESLEKAFDVAPDGRPDAMEKVTKSVDELDDFVRDFASSSHPKDALYPGKVEQWGSTTLHGYGKSSDLAGEARYVECLKFIHDKFFSDLETAMDGVVEALMTFEEKSANDWLATQKIEDFEERCNEYISRVFPLIETAGATSSKLNPDSIASVRGRILHHQRICNRMRSELDHLIAHYGVVGGDKDIVDAAKALQSCLLGLSECLKRIAGSTPDERQGSVNALIMFLGRLYFSASKFNGSLYHQKHAFYFREVKKWAECLMRGLHAVYGYVNREDIDGCLTFVCYDLLTSLEMAMFGISAVPKAAKLTAETPAGVSTGSVAEELKTFGKEFLPKFLVDQMERDTTRYVNLTTIATFFSSVTATTLQFTYAATDAVPSNSLRGVVNLFWFLSLVFSVSSGVSSLLGLTWRKSSIYDSRVPPRLIRMWFDKAPMLFLIIAAVAFVLGLNLFAYLSLQPHFVSLATNISTGLHGMCLLAVVIWFIYQLKHDSVWAGWIRIVLKPITTFADWIIMKSTKWITKGIKRITKDMKWIKTRAKWMWKMVKRPYDKYKRNLHLQRNIFWAFGIDNRVARLNYSISWRRDWPNPYLLSKIIRFIVYPTKKGWLVTKKAFSDFGHFVRVHICACSPVGRTEGDIESVGGERHEKAEGPEETQAENLAKNAENEFCEALLTTFNDETANWVMSRIKGWKREIMRSEEDAKHYIGIFLWGYPDLRKKCHNVVLTAWIDEREKSRRKIQERQHREAVAEQANIDPLRLVSEVVEKDQDTTVPAQATPPQASQPAFLHEDAEHLSLTQMEVKADSFGQVDHPPPPLNERPPSTVSPSPVAPASTPVDPNLQSSTPVMGRGVATLDESEEITSITENENDEELGG